MVIEFVAPEAGTARRRMTSGINQARRISEQRPGLFQIPGRYIPTEEIDGITRAAYGPQKLRPAEVARKAFLRPEVFVDREFQYVLNKTGDGQRLRGVLGKKTEVIAVLSHDLDGSGLIYFTYVGYRAILGRAQSCKDKESGDKGQDFKLHWVVQSFRIGHSKLARE